MKLVVIIILKKELHLVEDLGRISHMPLPSAGTISPE
jgi:hypothetical protein